MDSIPHTFERDYFNGRKLSAYDDYKTCQGIVHVHAKIILDAVKKFGFNPASSFDAGCAYGYIVEYMLGQGLDSHGSDISEYAISEGRDILADRVSVSPLPALEGMLSYDLVTCSEVLEHIPFDDIVPSLRRLYDITNPGGVMVIMPNMSNDGTWFSKDPGDPSHVSMVPRSWWTETMRELGFQRHAGIEKELNGNQDARNICWGSCEAYPEGRFFAIVKP